MKDELSTPVNIFVSDGIYVDCVTDDFDTVYQNADVINEYMIKILQDDSMHTVGDWLWTFYIDFTEAVGIKLED